MRQYLVFGGSEIIVPIDQVLYDSIKALQYLSMSMYAYVNCQTIATSGVYRMKNYVPIVGAKDAD
jgi:hypothetical protein